MIDIRCAARGVDFVNGATVHWVNAHYDEGAIVAQVSLPIPDHITTPEALAGVLLPHEHQLLINVLKNIASDHA